MLRRRATARFAIWGGGQTPNKAGETAARKRQIQWKEGAWGEALRDGFNGRIFLKKEPNYSGKQPMMAGD